MGGGGGARTPIIHARLIGEDYYFLDVDSAIWLVEMCHMMLKY